MKTKTIGEQMLDAHNNGQGFSVIAEDVTPPYPYLTITKAKREFKKLTKEQRQLEDTKRRVRLIEEDIKHNGQR